MSAAAFQEVRSNSATTSRSRATRLPRCLSKDDSESADNVCRLRLPSKPGRSVGRSRLRRSPGTGGARGLAPNQDLAREPESARHLHAPRDHSGSFLPRAGHLDKGQVELITLGGVTFGRATLQPGWSWSTCVKPIVNTESCQAPHLQYHVSGRLRVRMDDGSEDEFGPGEVSLLPPGHDAWVIGNEPVVVIDVT